MRAPHFANEARPTHPSPPSMAGASAHQPPHFRAASDWQHSSDARQYTDPLDLLASVAVAERQHRQLISSSRMSSAVAPPQPLPPLAPMRFEPAAAGVPDIGRSSSIFSSSRSYSRGRLPTRRPSTPPQHSPVPPHREPQGYPSLRPGDIPGSTGSPTQRHNSHFDNPQPVSPEVREQFSSASLRASAQQPPNGSPSASSPPARTLVSPLLQKAYITSPVPGRSSLVVPSPSLAKDEAHTTAESSFARAPSPAATPQTAAAQPAQSSDAQPATSSEPANPPTQKADEQPAKTNHVKDEAKRDDVVMEDPNASLPTPTQDDHVIQDPVNLLNALVAQNEASSSRDIAQFTPEAGDVVDSTQLDAPKPEDGAQGAEEAVPPATSTLHKDASGDIEMTDAPKTDIIPTAEPAPLPTVMEAEEMTEVVENPSAKSRKPRNVTRAQRKSIDRAAKPAANRPTDGQDTCSSCGGSFAQDDGSKGPWIECDGCKSWVHASCAGFEISQVKKIDKFYCSSCQKTYGPSTMKRSSGRAHTAIDYNALHNGSAIPLRNPEDARLHPYINIIRDKTYPFAEETFRRVRPEFVTAENLDNMPGGWNEPIVVPAYENARPWHDSDATDDNDPDTPTSVPSPVDLAGPKVMLPLPAKGDTKDDLVPPKTGNKEDANRRDGLDMMIPKDLTVRKVGEVVGMDRPVEVFNVLTQQSTERWKMNDLVNYFENPSRDVIYNCISCEVTNTTLGSQISRPRAVRDTDLVDRVWRHVPYIARPTVGKYVLMSVKDSFTDFHIDFAGSSVFYHVYEGEKVFLLIEPTEKSLKAYEAWNLDPHMSAKFFPESIPDIPCKILTLHKGDTMFIPSGWIHAVYTPADSLVIGGNFLTKNHYANQMKVHHIEVVTGVSPNMKYPRYTTLMWFQALNYMENDPVPENVESLLIDGKTTDIAAAKVGAQPEKMAKYTPEELQGLSSLLKFLHRNVMITLGVVTTGQGPGNLKLTQRTVDAVKRAAPDPINKDPLGFLKRFARWCTWKRIISGVAPEERIPDWAQPSWTPPEKPKVEVAKKPSKFDLKPVSDVPRRNGLRERRGTSISPEQEQPQQSAPAPAPQSTPAAKPAATAPLSAPPSKRKSADQDAPPATTSSKKPKTAKSSRSASSSNNRASEIPIILGEGEQRVVLSDGSIYVRKNSNLGPPRAGCQNCRLKKTGCKHKEEIAEILKGTWTAARAAHQAKLEALEKEKDKDKGKDSVSGQKEKPGSGNGQLSGKAKEGDEMVLDEYAIASESDDEPLSSPPPPEKIEVKKRRISAVKKAKEPSVQPSLPAQQQQPASTESTQTRSGTSLPPTAQENPAPMFNGTGPPAGFKGRKPSCNECKALKKKCLHPNTWHNLPSRPPPTPSSHSKKGKSNARRKSTSNIELAKHTLTTETDMTANRPSAPTPAATFTPTTTTGASSAAASSKGASPPPRTPEREFGTQLETIPATPSTVRQSPPPPPSAAALDSPAPAVNGSSRGSSSSSSSGGTREYVVSHSTSTTITTAPSTSKTKPRTTNTSSATSALATITPVSTTSKTQKLRTPPNPSSTTTAKPHSSSSSATSSRPVKTPLKRRADDEPSRSTDKVKKRISVDQLRTGLDMSPKGVEQDVQSQGKGSPGSGDEEGMYRAMALGLRVRKASVAGR